MGTRTNVSLAAALAALLGSACGSSLPVAGVACTRFLGAGGPTLTAEWPCGTIIG